MSRRAGAEKAWTQATAPETLMEAIRSLLEQENTAGARKLAAEAVAIFPDDPQLQQAHHFFRPYKVTPSPVLEPNRSRAFARLDDEAPKLRGLWVALSEDDVVASAETLKELLALVEPMGLKHPPLVHFIE
jgi:hypothetical protein